MPVILEEMSDRPAVESFLRTASEQ